MPKKEPDVTTDEITEIAEIRRQLKASRAANGTVTRRVNATVIIQLITMGVLLGGLIYQAGRLQEQLTQTSNALSALQHSMSTDMQKLERQLSKLDGAMSSTDRTIAALEIRIDYLEKGLHEANGRDETLAYQVRNLQRDIGILKRSEGDE